MHLSRKYYKWDIITKLASGSMNQESNAGEGLFYFYGKCPWDSNTGLFPERTKIKCLLRILISCKVKSLLTLTFSFFFLLIPFIQRNHQRKGKDKLIATYSGLFQLIEGMTLLLPPHSFLFLVQRQIGRWLRVVWICGALNK